ncbi:MAG TPA: c-type cytochrome [Polyangia bacterium]|jgi:uncharacterized membrane protein|nr:c-type cytochrome [Polyangia bacterium]
MTRTLFPWLAIAALGCAASRGPDTGMEPLTCTAVAPRACAVEPPPRYAEIASIVQARCVSCHDGADPLGPWPLTTYDDVADWNDTIRDELVACTMPPADSGMTIPDEERQALLMWLRCGFLE